MSLEILTQEVSLPVNIGCISIALIFMGRLHMFWGQNYVATGMVPQLQSIIGSIVVQLH